MKKVIALATAISLSLAAPAFAFGGHAGGWGGGGFHGGGAGWGGHRTRGGRRVSLGFTDGRRPAGIVAGGGDVLLLCGALCVRHDGGREGIKKEPPKRLS